MSQSIETLISSRMPLSPKMEARRIEVYETFIIFYPTLRNVQLKFSERILINDIEVCGVTIFKNRIPAEIQISTNIYKRVERKEQDIINILLHEITHAISDSKLNVNDIVQHNTNKSNRKKTQYKNNKDTHHNNNFGKNYVKIVQIASDHGFINADKKLIDINYVKKIDREC